MQVQGINNNPQRAQSFGFRTIDVGLSNVENAAINRIMYKLLDIGDNMTDVVILRGEDNKIIATGIRDLKPFADSQVSASVEKKAGYVDFLKDLALNVQTVALKEYERLSADLMKGN